MMFVSSISIRDASIGGVRSCSRLARRPRRISPLDKWTSRKSRLLSGLTPTPLLVLHGLPISPSSRSHTPPRLAPSLSRGVGLSSSDLPCLSLASSRVLLRSTIDTRPFTRKRAFIRLAIACELTKVRPFPKGSPPTLAPSSLTLTRPTKSHRQPETTPVAGGTISRRRRLSTFVITAASGLFAMCSQAIPMLMWLIVAKVLETSVNAFQPSTLSSTPRHVPSNVRVRQQSVSLNGKLWKRLQIEEDDPADGTQWYLINCVAGIELDLLNQCRMVCEDFPPRLVEKFVVPTQRHLRSHGDKKKVVDVKVRYPGYVFCKICLVEDVYEKLQNLELARSWMGTVNRKGHKKLPPSPLPLNEEEVKKFKGLEEEQELFEDMFAGDYSGRNDTGADLLAQYQGYDVGQMVKILRGNFKDEDGTVRRLKDGQLMVRMFTYGQTYDEWFDPDAIRPLTDLEVLRGMSGPTVPVNQDQFDVSIGKKDPSILEGTARDSSMQSESSLRSGLMQSSGAAPGRNRREDRVARGETGQRDMFGRSSMDIKKEEENWLAYREERRAGARGEASAPAPIETPKKKAEGPKKGQDTW